MGRPVMSTYPSVSEPPPSGSSPDDGTTERVDAIARLDERVRREAVPVDQTRPPTPLAPGRYLELQGPSETLLVRLEREVTRIGRGLAADVRLDDNSVSRRHALLVCDQSGARVLDDRSSNGTLLNGARVEQAALKSGDVLLLGRVALRYLEV
jgi:pSer/pThr/pTyr-binding forkhead associated (FHA) protein